MLYSKNIRAPISALLGLPDWATQAARHRNCAIALQSGCTKVTHRSEGDG